MSPANARSPKAAAPALQIGDWRLDARGNTLLRGAQVLRLEPKAIEVLACLAERQGEVLGREELLQRVWPGVVVGDDVLTQAIIKLRKALGDDAQAPPYIDTISKRGYRLTAPVSAVAPAGPGGGTGARRRGWANEPAAYFAAAVLVVLGAVLIAPPVAPWLTGWSAKAPATSASIPTVAMLPLANLSGDAARDYFSDGIRPTASLGAHSERPSNREARALLARALELDPQYAEAQAELGFAEFQRATEGWVVDAAQAMRHAEVLGKQALASADTRAHVGAHALLANIYGHQERYDDALAHAQRAIALNPSDPVALHWRGSAALSLGRVDEAVGFLEAARRFEPRAAAGRALNLAIAYYMAGRYADAWMQADWILAATPRNGYAHALRAAALARGGRSDEARAAAEQVRRVDPLFDAENFGARFVDPKSTAQLRAGLREAGL